MIRKSWTPAASTSAAVRACIACASVSAFEQPFFALPAFGQSSDHTPAGTQIELTYQRLLEDGRHLVAAGRTEEALAKFREAQRMMPEEGSAYADIIDACLKLGQLDEAESALSEILKRRPNLINEPVIADLRTALEAAKAANQSTEIRLRLDSARRLGQRRETARDAQADLDAVLALDPHNADAKQLKEETKERWQPHRGDVLTVELQPNLTIEMVYIEPGVFWMGSTQSPQEVIAAYSSGDQQSNEDFAQWIANEHPRHKVRLTRGLWLGRTEVTVNQFLAFAQESEYQTTAERLGKSYVWVGREGKFWELQDGIDWRNPGLEQAGNHPVVHVSSADADAFCTWLTEKHRGEGRITDHQRYRLPTEAEWEYACRAGTTTAYWFGDRLEQGNGTLNGAGQDEGWSNEATASSCWPFNDGWAKRTAPVASFRANPWGLHDTHGNVQEWCSDWYDATWYEPVTLVSNDTGERANPKGPQTGEFRVLRGGSWINNTWYLRSAFRSTFEPSYSDISVGFRLCLDSE